MDGAGLGRRLVDHDYKVYRGTSSGGETLLTTLGNVTSYTDSTATNGTTYFYKVSAVNTVGEGALSNERSATPRRRRPCRARRRWLCRRRVTEGRAAVDGAGLGRRLADHGLQDLPRHEQRRRDAADDARQRHQLHRLGRHNGTTYFYKVSAVNTVGEGALSNERQATPQPPATVPGAPTLDRRQRATGASRCSGRRRARTAARRSRTTRSIAARAAAARRC